MRKKDITTILAIADEIARQPGTKLTIEKLASDHGINREKLKKAFKQVMGKGVHAYQISVRLKLAKQMLEEDEDIKIVAGKCGYSDTPAFTRFFKRETGISPSEYRAGATPDPT